MITSGKKYYNDEIYIWEPDLDVLQRASIIYQQIYNRCMSEKIHDSNSILNVLIGADLWSIQDEEDLTKNLPDRINDLKVQIFESNSLSYIRLSKELGEETQRLKDLYTRRHLFDNFLCEGISEVSKVEFIVENCTNANLEKISLDKLISLYITKYVEEKIIRELCRTNPWQDIWAASQKNHSYVFNQNSCLLSDNQKRLILWSSLYDNIKEYTDCPPSEIIENDTKLDGWLIKKNREKEVKKTQEQINISKNSKINNSQEIFVVVKNVEEARAVDAMNDYQGNLIKQSRLSKIAKDGSVSYKDFSDVKQELKIQINREVLKRNGR